MQDNELNAAIARWMGEYSEEPYTYTAFRKYDGPNYLHDPAAALRVLARMNGQNKEWEYILVPYERFSAVFKGCDIHETWYKLSYQPEPAAAICAAWLAEFGEQPRDGGKEEQSC